MKRKKYEEHLEPLELELNNLTRWLQHTGRRMVVLFEGFARFMIETREATIRVLPSCLLRLDVDDHGTRATCLRGKLYATPKTGQIEAQSQGIYEKAD